MLKDLAAPPRTRDERGSGLLSSVFGVVLFCGFLLLAAQVLLTLHRTSLVASAVADAAHAAAHAGGPGARRCGNAEEAMAVARAQALLGPATSAVAACAASSIRVEVSVPRPRLVSGLGSPTITRSATVRIESRQDGA